MGKLYRRIVTMGMISLTALLAWIYCILEYRSELVYLGGVSLMLLGSIYILFIFVVDLKYLKDETMQTNINNAVEKLKELRDTSKNDDDLERLVKALYVQVRKVNTVLAGMKEADADNAKGTIKATEDLNASLSESVNKLAKVVVKYNQSSNESTLGAIDNIGNKLSETYDQLEIMTLAINSVASGIDNVSDGMGKVADVIPFPGNDASEKKDISAAEPEEPETAAPDIEESGDPNKMMTPEEIAALFSSVGVSPEEDTAAADDIEEVTEFGTEVSESEESEAAPSVVEPENPNKMMTPEEIAALFSSMGV